jgi:hypothetical protein
MTSTLFDIFFSGQILQDQDIDQVKQAVAKIFKADDTMLERLFSGTPVRVKSGVDQETAIKYRVTFRQAGAIIDIKPTESSIEPSISAATPPQEPLSPSDGDDMTLLPPRTGDLLDCAIEPDATPIGDISYMALAPEGTDIDETEPPPNLNIDTSALEIEPDRE